MVEGLKSVHEVVKSGWEVKCLVSLEPHLFEAKYPFPVYLAKAKEMERMSDLKSFSPALAVVAFKTVPFSVPTAGKYLVLDGIQDPGNLGTIIRSADWYGLNGIFCSHDTAELYNPKCIQSSMGSFLRMPVWQTDLKDLLERVTLPVMAADMNGESAHLFQFPESALLLIGNEGQGIRMESKNFTYRVTIPKIGEAESLNAAVATSILLDRWTTNK